MIKVICVKYYLPVSTESKESIVIPVKSKDFEIGIVNSPISRY